MVKKIFALMLVLVMAASCCALAAEENTMLISETPADTTAKVVLEATEPDADGYFTMSLTAYNFEFMGMQAYITYNPEAVVPVSKDTKEATEDFDAFAEMTVTAEKDGKEITNVATLVMPKITNKEGKFSFALFPDLKTYPNSLVNNNKRFVINENGVQFLEFHFKKISGKDADFKAYSSIRSEIPDGVKVVNVVDKNYTVATVFILPSSVNSVQIPETEYEVIATTVTSDDSADSKTPMEQRVKDRSKNVIFLGINNYATVSDSVLKWVDKDNKAVKPYIKEDRTMVPLRFIAEELGATVGYDDETRAITITLGDTVMGLTVDQKAYTLNGEAFEMDCAAEILENRTFVPVRFVSEALGRSVEWLEGQRMVIITTTTYPWDKDNGVEKTLLSEIQLMMSPLVRDLAYSSEQ